MARFYVEKAIEIMSELAPSNQIMLASAKRVKALILEEIALDNMVSPNARDYKGLLKESEELHRSALQLSLDAFGEINVQTAKHYGNLGRLYQSMTKYEDAEEMHQRAIKIKRDLLGDFDYEVGLSIGHLASLYNYHMKKYREAEELYVKSINISEYHCATDKSQYFSTIMDIYRSQTIWPNLLRPGIRLPRIASRLRRTA